MVIRRCVVPLCNNTSATHRRKLFIRVPAEAERRMNWLVESGLDHTQIPPNLSLFVCEDHFNLQEDIENYTEWRSTGERKRMKPTALPSKFECQIPHRSRNSKNKLVKLASKYASLRTEAQELVEVVQSLVEVVQSQDMEISEPEPDNTVGVQVSMGPETRTVATQCFFPLGSSCDNCPPKTPPVSPSVRPCTTNNNSEFDTMRVKRLRPSSPIE